MCNPSISRIHIAYGSESGNAQALATELANQPFLQAYPTALSTLNDTDLNTLDNQTLLVIITSSFGDGEPPENADEFLETLEKMTALSSRYCVFGLGDVTYDYFCGFSKQVDEVLQQKQAKPLIERVDADLNFREIFKQWLPLLQQALTELPAQPLSHALSVQVYNENTVYQAEVLEIQRLAQAEPAVYHLRLSLKDSGIFYQAGDLVYVQIEQPDEALAPYAEWFGDKSAVEILRKKELRLLSKNVLRDISKITGNAELKDLTKISNKKALESYLYGHDLLDVLRDFDPEKKVSLADVTEMLANLTARAYSISSCGKTHPEYTDLCIRHIHYRLGERDYQGTASDQLAQLKVGQKIPVFVKANPTFRLPEHLNAPLVMIGSGTGIAPFIGFLQYLEGQQVKVESDLFFGERHRATDFLYQETLENFRQQGVLTHLFTAFSRDQAEKYYVQNALSAQAEHIWSRIQQGAYFYICGSKSMSKAVDDALIQIASDIGNRPYVDAFDNIVAELVAAGRLLRDVY
ncbi:diflavin oxidoreductase [Aggregatibacter kilianii]|uniref:diflavin oxidoreductase n=1 Tax=Aggregatibacter kilianii TaxID=2025884 RepID=UPI000D648A71|nr:sulfite reductase flavoprotein subunit alpha [Aggregatibacter kilianii]